MPVVQHRRVEFIFMLTRRDRTVEDAADLVDAACEMGVRHVGFKDVGVDPGTMTQIVRKVRGHGGTSYLEVVSTTADSIARSLATARDLGVDRILGGTDLAAAQAALGRLDGYFPFPGRPVGHPTSLRGTPRAIADDCARALAAGCGGVDLLAYRATESAPLDLVRAARGAMQRGMLIVAGSVRSVQQIEALRACGVDAFTVGSAVFEGTFSPAGRTLRSQLSDVLLATGS
jgi:thiamine monophosphate synthase